MTGTSPTHVLGNSERLFPAVGAPAVESPAAAVRAGSMPALPAALFGIPVNSPAQLFGDTTVSGAVKGVFRCLRIPCLLANHFP